MKRGLINEDIQKMMNLINYDRGKTLTENRQSTKGRLLNEQVGALGAILKAAGLSHITSSVAPVIYGGLGDFTSNLIKLLGSGIDDLKMSVILSPNTWKKLNDAFNGLEASFEVEKGFLRDRIAYIGATTSREIASSLEDNMTGLDITGAGERNVIRTYGRIPTVFDAVGVSAAFGTRKGDTLSEWLDDDGISTNSLESVLSRKNYIVFNGKSYKTLQSATVAMVQALAAKSKSNELNQEAQTREGEWEKNFPCVVNYPKSQQKDLSDGTTVYVIGDEMYFNNGRKRTADGRMVNYSCDDEIFKNQDLSKLFEDYPCVVAETKNQSNKVEHPYKGNVNQVYITLENGDVMLVDTSGKYVARVGGQKSEGTIECPDDFKISGEEELTLSEGYYLFEQSFGGITLKPSTPSSGAASDETSSSSSRSSGSSATAEQIELAKAYREWANSTDELSKKYGKNSKFDLDKTTSRPYNNYFLRSYEAGKAEYEASLASGDVASDENKASGKEAGKEAGEKVTPQEETQIDRVVREKEGVDPETIDDEIQQLQQAISQQPTKDQCKDLIATAAAGIKMGVTLTDTSSLEQCYNSYNFGIGQGSLKVKKHYGLKGKGN
jgi:hypothetical protein